MVQEIPDIKVAGGQKSISEKYRTFVTCSVLWPLLETEYWPRCTVSLACTFSLILRYLGAKDNNIPYGHQLISDHISV